MMIGPGLRAAIAGGALLSGTILSGSAEAGLLGNTFQVSYFVPDLAAPYASASTSTVTASGSNPDASIIVEDVLNIAVDIRDDRVVLTYSELEPYPNNGWDSHDFSGVVLDLVGTSFAALGFSAVQVTNSGFFADGTTTPASVLGGLSGSRLALNWQGLDYNQNGATVTAVLTPVPAALPLLATALCGLVCWRRRAGTSGAPAALG